MASLRDLQPTDQHRCVLVLSGPGLDPRVSDTDPGDRGMPACVKTCCRATGRPPEDGRKINRFHRAGASRSLPSHPVNLNAGAAGKLPANGVITRGAGGRIQP